MRLRRLFTLLLLASTMLASTARAQVLYWLDTNHPSPTLNKADAGGNAISSVALPAGTLPEGLACEGTGKIFWAEGVVSGARIQRAAPTLSSITTMVSGGSALRGIAVDDVAHMLYWTSSNLATGSRIHRSAVDGSGATVLISLGSVANPRGIAVDHAGGKIYWTDFDQDALYRANLDGSSMELWLPLPSSSRPYGVAFDPIGNEVYWTEYAGKIRRVSTSGGTGNTLVGGLSNPTYIALDPAGGRMYWSEGGAGAQQIYRGQMSPGGGRTALGLPLTTYGGLAFEPNATVSAPDATQPSSFTLAPLHPNPSQGVVRTEFALPRETRVRLTVIDVQGREVAVLADGTFPAGRHAASWDAKAGRVPPGIYFVRLSTEDRAFIRRLVRAR